MTANTFGVVSIDIATYRVLIFADAEDGILWTEDDAVVAFETHAAAHAATSFFAGFVFA